MRYILPIFLLISVSSTGQGFDDIMISPEELRSTFSSENVVVLHTGYADGYAKGHIPEAIFIGSRDFTSTSADSLYWQLPAIEDFKSALQARGIDNNSQIIICSDWQSFAPAFRLYFTFDYFGLADRVSILDGGVKGWDSRQYPLSSDTVVAKVSTDELSFKENKELIVYKDWVKQNIGNNKIAIIDARTEEYYSGSKDGDGHYKRPGHIPGAKNITWKHLVDENNFLLDEKSLKAKFKESGIKKKQEVVNYCHVGLRASVLYTVAKCLGYKTRLYDGSYNEWDRLDEGYPFDQVKN